MTPEPRAPRRFDGVDDALAYLASFTDFEQKHAASLDRKALDLGRVAALMSAFDHPERAFASAHVAGSKGKGSTCSLIRALGQACELRTGLFLSPHLTRVNERIQIDGRPIDDRAFADLVETISLFVDERGRSGAVETLPSFFEAMTLMGFLAFRSARVDLAVVEVGMGGRLDATNVLDAEVAVVTAIDLEHTRILGETLEAIAAEKAGIFKPGRAAVTALDPRGGPGAVVAARARALACPLLALGRDVHVEVRERRPDGSQVIDVLVRPAGADPVPSRVDERRFIDLELGPSGDHQAANAACALAATLALEAEGVLRCDEDAMRRALAALRLPARLEWFPPRPGVCPAPLLLDCAHTPASMQALAQATRARFPDRRPTLILGMLRDKRVEDCLERLEGLFDEVWTVAPSSPRAIDADELGRRVRALWPAARVEAVDDLDALRARLAATDRPGLVVGGSVYLAGVVRGWLDLPGSASARAL